MANTELDIRRHALEEAAVEICGYCQNTEGYQCAQKTSDGWLHLFRAGNGSNPCASGPIWDMVAASRLDLAQKDKP